MAALIGQIVSLIVDIVDAAIRRGRNIRQALAEGFEEAARKIRAGELNIDEAVARAEEDQKKLDALRDKLKDPEA